MKIFDTHCDTIYECYKQGKSLYRNNLHLSLEKMSTFDQYVQVFAIWMPDEFRGEEAQKHYEACLFKYRQELTIYKDIVGESLSENAPQITALLAVEGGSVLLGDPARVEQLHNDGVKLITLTWNGDNELGSGCFSKTPIGCLTEVGRMVIKEMNRFDMLVDVSHLSEKGFYQVCELSEKPFIASHSNAKEVCDNPRNLTKDQIKCMIERKCLMGLNFYKKFLQVDGKAGLEDVYCHADFFLSQGAEDLLCLGSDFDGADIPEDLNGAEKLTDLYNLFLKKGLSQTLTDKIFFENAYDFFSKSFQEKGNVK